ncbi:MAG: SDR family oxidoreductase [Actinomycetota bacterium]|jgi:NAD(P)-dependent dehydrogenase (short-subunit alcohol dehydrogenase family)|nr:SDR family oxidoreductase [Actinomycetota bacterium]
MPSTAQPVVVTGAASGIGLALCHRLSAAGHALVTIDRDNAPNDLDVARHYQCDLSDPQAVNDLIVQLDSDLDLSAVAALANVAGVPGTLPHDVVLEVNLLAVRALCRGLAPRLGDGAAIVNVGSISGNGWAQRLDLHRQLLALDDENARDWWTDRSPSIDVDPYSFSKEALIVYSMLLAGELLGTGIRCNVVSPGPVETPLLPTFREQIGDDRIDWVLSHAGRAAKPDEIAQGIEWLAVGESHWVNGHHLVIDGGYTSGLLSGWVDVDSAPEPKHTFVD